jgi:hypothetical protein
MVIGLAVAIVGSLLVGGDDSGVEGDLEVTFVEELDPAAHPG